MRMNLSVYYMHSWVSNFLKKVLIELKNLQEKIARMMRAVEWLVY